MPSLSVSISIDKKYFRCSAAAHTHGDFLALDLPSRWNLRARKEADFELGASLPLNAIQAARTETMAVPASASQPALSDCVARAVRRYLQDMGDAEIGDLHELVLREMEKPLFNEVLRHCDGNQSRAAATLGINRSTLRKKLREYGLA